MEALMSIAIGFMFACGTFLMLRRSILRLIVGIVLLSHGVNLLLFTMGGLKKSPFLGNPEPAIPVLSPDPGPIDASLFADPLVQALILTAIVISFGVTAFLLVAGYRAQQEYNTDDLDELRRLRG